MCKNSANWIMNILFTLIFSARAKDEVNNEFIMLNTNDSIAHPWLPIGNFSNILNQSYTLDTYTEPKVNGYQIESENVLSVYKVIDETENSNKSDDINREGNLDEPLPSFFDDSPTKDEDYAGGAYGNDDDNDGESDDGNLRSNFISREDGEDK